MKRRIIPIICLALLCAALLCPFNTQAATSVDPEAEASLTLIYQKNEVAFADLEIAIYRVAEVLPNGTYELIEPFSTYPLSIHGITKQEQWGAVADTLSAYIIANQIDPDREATTDGEGIVSFANLKTGLYMVEETVGENNSGTYLFNRFMVYLPTPQGDGSYDYSIEAKPKCTGFVPKTQYRVTKLWQDAGHQSDRPLKVSVDIYKDGELYETQILSPHNDWSYVWYVSEADHSSWTVVEGAVSEKYTVTIKKSDSSFSIVNTHKSGSRPPDAPQTGDSSTPIPMILTMCISGVALLILGIYRRRQA